MANIFVGFHDNRSCNRILKPPGGGTSNIFGTEPIPDVVPKNSPRRDKNGGSIQQILNTENSTTVSKREENRSFSNGDCVEKTHHIELTNDIKNEDPTELIPRQTQPEQDLTPQRNDQKSHQETSSVTTKIEQLQIRENSSTILHTETDSAGNTRVISNVSKSENSIEQNSGVKSRPSIGDILKQGDLVENGEKKKVRSPNQRVPPGGYSSGLW